MTKRAVAVGVLAGLFALMGCGSEEVPDTTALEEAAAVDSPEPPALSDEQFVTEIRKAVPSFEAKTEANLEEMADAYCGIWEGSLSDGATDEETWLITIRALTDSGLEGYEAGSVAVWLTGWKCPEYVDRLGT